MTLSAIVLDLKGFSPIMTSTAGCSSLHVFHGYGLVLLDVSEKLWVAGLAGLFQPDYMALMAEYHVPPLILQDNFATPNRCHCRWGRYHQ
jgi:hypothetical protein